MRELVRAAVVSATLVGVAPDTLVAESEPPVLGEVWHRSKLVSPMRPVPSAVQPPTQEENSGFTEPNRENLPEYFDRLGEPESAGITAAAETEANSRQSIDRHSGEALTENGSDADPATQPTTTLDHTNGLRAQELHAYASQSPAVHAVPVERPQSPVYLSESMPADAPAAAVGFAIGFAACLLWCPLMLFLLSRWRSKEYIFTSARSDFNPYVDTREPTAPPTVRSASTHQEHDVQRRVDQEQTPAQDSAALTGNPILRHFYLQNVEMYEGLIASQDSASAA